jgi:hypothetical protein
MKVRNVGVRRVWDCMLCTCVSRYVSLTDLDTLYRVGWRDPIHLCTYVNEEGGDGETVVSEASALFSYTLRYVSLTELGTLCRVGLRDPMHLCACVIEEVGTGREREPWDASNGLQ